jgi:hypothetical protein
MDGLMMACCHLQTSCVRLLILYCNTYYETQLDGKLKDISDLLFSLRPTVESTELSKLTVLLNKSQKDDFPWWCRSVTMSLLPVGISGDETEKLAISCKIRMHHHSTTATFTALLLQYNVHEDREQSNPHTGPSFAHRSLSGTRWRKAVPALSSCISKSVGWSK